MSRPTLPLANRGRDSLEVNSKMLVAVYSGSPRLIIENIQSISTLAAQDYTLLSSFTLWESFESETCALFLASSRLPFHINLVPQPGLKELADLYQIPFNLLGDLPENHSRLLNQFHGTKLAYEAAKNYSNSVLGVEHPFWLRSRSDLYVDQVFAKTIKRQLDVQLNHEVVFSAPAFGNGVVDGLWLSGPCSSDTMFSVVDGLAELWALEYFFPTEVVLKLYADKHAITYSINRMLPSSKLGKKDGRLYIRSSALRVRRHQALLTANYRIGHGNTKAYYQSLISCFLEGIKGLPADLRLRYRLLKQKKS